MVTEHWPRSQNSYKVKQREDLQGTPGSREQKGRREKVWLGRGSQAKVPHVCRGQQATGCTEEWGSRQTGRPRAKKRRS